MNCDVTLAKSFLWNTFLLTCFCIFLVIMQHIEDLTQEKFSLQRALEASRALAESLAAENSSLTESYNQQVFLLYMILHLDICVTFTLLMNCELNTFVLLSFCLFYPIMKTVVLTSSEMMPPCVSLTKSFDSAMAHGFILTVFLYSFSPENCC